MAAELDDTRARARVAEVLRSNLRHSIKVEPGGAEWIEAGTESVHLAELALRLADAAAGSNPPDGAVGVIANAMLSSTLINSPVTSRPAAEHLANEVLAGLQAEGFQVVR